MAEAALFTIASKILSTVAAPAFEKGCEKACSIRNARDELNELKASIGMIQAVLLDAERKQEHSAAVKVWIKSVKCVLYDADDLFDEVATDDLLRSHVKGSTKLEKKVRVTFSRLNPFVSNNDIANRVKTITKRLQSVSNGIGPLNFAVCQHDVPISGMRRDQNPGSFVDPKNVFGRDKDKEVILEWLLQDQSDGAQQDVQVIAIVGIGGLGKTTLTQLVYNHEEVKMSFEERWFACISDTTDDAEVGQKICQSICGEMPHSTGDPQSMIKESTEGKKFLLVLDDVWDDDRVRWKSRMSLLSSGTKGSKIIVSTRSSLVSRAVGALKTHVLEGLSEEHSWELFKSVVSFTPGQEANSKWTDLGKQIVKKCANVPLAINCIASLLFGKNTIQEWELIRDEELPQLGQSHMDGIMPVLKLSYEHLPSNLKHCFAYCSLFPKDHVFEKEELVKLWIAQGYIHPNNENQTVENVGHSYFMDLVRRSFFQEESWDDLVVFKMHDLIHDLAKYVAGEECLMLTASSKEISETRHVSVGYGVDYSWLLPKPFHKDSVYRLRSLLFHNHRYSGSRRSLLFHNDRYLGSRLVLGKQFTNLKSLRALSLYWLNIENVPSCIGELKHLRYLDISGNVFKKLPDSISKLVNLCTLNISSCRELEAWPDNFGKLINLRHLHNGNCYSLKQHLPGFEELASLQNLDKLIVDKDDWAGVECWPPSLVSLQKICIRNYKRNKMPAWANGRTPYPSVLATLASLKLYRCPGVKCLPPFRHIPNLKKLSLKYLKELEYIEDEKVGSDGLFLPDLKELALLDLPKLKGWSRKVEQYSSSTPTTPPHQLLSFPTLLRICIYSCPEFKSMLLCPRLQSMNITSVAAEIVLLLISDHISSPSITKSPSCLEDVDISCIDLLESFPGESLMCLRSLRIFKCIKLKKVELPPLHLNNLQRLALSRCPELELWEEKERGVDWDSLHNLIQLSIDVKDPSLVRLPDCLLHRHQRRQLEIIFYNLTSLSPEVMSVGFGNLFHSHTKASHLAHEPYTRSTELQTRIIGHAISDVPS